METDKLTIGKKDFIISVGELPQADLKFYVENPRVYSVLNSSGKEPSQDEIEEYMKEEEHVKELKESILNNGGLIDPLIVRDGDFTVLEGNSRLAAYRILFTKDPIKWGKVPCKILPADIEEKYIFQLLGQFHIVGRKDWEPYEQANYLYRRTKETKYPIENIAEELGIGVSDARRMVETVDFMIQRNDLEKKHWSYYFEYLKNSDIKRFRDTNPDIDETITEQIKTNSIKKASDMRKVAAIAKQAVKNKDKQSMKVMQKISTGEIDLYEGYETVKDSGKLDDIVQKLQKFKLMINDDSFEKQLKSSSEVYEKAMYEIKKIINRLENIKKK